MIIQQHLSLTFNNHNALLRCLYPTDITTVYIRSLRTAGDYLSARSGNITKTDQINYINGISESPRDAIFGFFVERILVGTAGIQNIVGTEITSLGVFLFDRRYQGIGLGKTIVWGCCRLLNHTHRVTRFRAGIDPSNLPSLMTFINCGFHIAERSEEKYRVQLHIGNINRPSNIVNVKVV